MEGHHREVCEIAMRYKDSKDAIVKKTAIMLFPVLASYNTNEFVTHYLHQVMNFLLLQLKKERDRAPGIYI
jgi:FKBP12-rapamycin complex-associated protein